MFRTDLDNSVRISLVKYKFIFDSESSPASVSSILKASYFCPSSNCARDSRGDADANFYAQSEVLETGKRNRMRANLLSAR